MQYSTAILGASGYVGLELIRLLSQNPNFKIKVLSANSQAGQNIADAFPHLAATCDGKFVSMETALSRIGECEVVFSALPHGEGMKILPALKNKLIVDLSSDFRLKDPSLYDRWYGKTHEAPPSLAGWIYALPELFRERIKGAVRISNPGCYATASILAAAPLVRSKLCNGPLILNGISGLSGAGRSLKESLLFCHAEGDMRAYKVGSHPHTAEIEQALSDSGPVVTVSLTTHVAPLERGIVVTLSAELKPEVTSSRLHQAFLESYRNEFFIKLSSVDPGTKAVRGSNFAILKPTFDERLQRATVVCVIDNLVKGAAGQAIQNAQCALGICEYTGLEAGGFYP
jgi:N-acetyl-gamma-glutamyl-phosphate reductase